MNVRIEDSWKAELKEEFEKAYFHRLAEFLRSEYATCRIYPKGSLIFNAFNRCPFEQTRVVIVGQDPYHGRGQANGLCFSVNDGVAVPPSLQNIFREVKDDIGGTLPKSGNLERWADQGVLMLNATLTVREGKAGSHQNKGWEVFTDAVLRHVSNKKRGVVFLLWGAYAQRKEALIDTVEHLALKAPHPSPFSADRGFVGCKHFSKANHYLASKNKPPIHWSL